MPILLKLMKSQTINFNISSNQKVLFGGILFFISSTIFAQQNNRYQLKSTFQTGDVVSNIEIANNGDTIMVSKIALKNTITSNIEIDEKTYKGTPLLFNSWFSAGSTFLGKTLTKGNIAYNLVNKDVQISTDGLNLANSLKPDSFIVNNIKFVKVKVGNLGYCVLINSNINGSLYRQFSCRYLPKVQGQKTGYELSNDIYEGTYQKFNTLFLVKNNEALELKLSKSVFKVFDDKKDILEKYAKDNDLNPKKEVDLIKIISHYLNL